MFTAIKRVRELLDSDYRHQMYLQRRQELTDPSLRRALVGVVTAIGAKAQATGWYDVDTVDGVTHSIAWWEAGPSVTAQETVHADGRHDYAIYAERGWIAGSLFPDDGPWLVSGDGDQVFFMPGAGFTTAESFLEHIAIDAEASTDTEQGRGSTMERERANSRYGRDPRVTWIPDSAVLCRILPADVPDQLPRSDLGWDGKIYSDEWLEFEVTSIAGTVSIFLTTTVARKELTWGAYLSIDVALETVLGEPR